MEAENGSPSLAAGRNQLQPALILVDINMPDMDGYALTAILRTKPHLSKVPIIALTANVMRGDRERTFAAGCDGYIQKPIDIDQFYDLINRYLKEVDHGG